MSPNNPLNTSADSSESLDKFFITSGISSEEPREINCAVDSVPISNTNRTACDVNVTSLPDTSVILPGEYERRIPRPTNANLTTRLFEFHWRKSVRALSNEQSMFHLLAAELGERSAIISCQNLGWNIDIGSGNLMPPLEVPQPSKRDL